MVADPAAALLAHYDAEYLRRFGNPPVHRDPVKEAEKLARLLDSLDAATASAVVSAFIAEPPVWVTRGITPAAVVQGATDILARFAGRAAAGGGGGFPWSAWDSALYRDHPRWLEYEQAHRGGPGSASSFLLYWSHRNVEIDDDELPPAARVLARYRRAAQEHAPATTSEELREALTLAAALVAKAGSTEAACDAVHREVQELLHGSLSGEARPCPVVRVLERAAADVEKRNHDREAMEETARRRAEYAASTGAAP